MRNTVQKSRIIEYLKKSRSHPNADMIFREVSKDIPGLSRATVYRILHQLVDLGVINKIEVNNQAYFDAHKDANVHCICDECGKIFDCGKIELDKEMLELGDFDPKSYSAVVSGSCRNCLEIMQDK